jgi:choline dehydrogenase
MAQDLVVIGAGSSGAVIAARVTEDAGRRVLLIEAGPHYEREADMPPDVLDGRQNSMKAHDWGFLYKPGSGREDFVFPRGKVTGGSSAVNTCIALRGQPYDYDEWAELGCPEWKFERCLPAFIRLETDFDRGGPIHGKSGPIPIHRATLEELVPFQKAFLTACGELGFEPCADHNDPATTGYGPHAMNRVKGKRVSTALGYLVPIHGRPNLTIRDRTLVRRVLVQGGRVTGVEVERGGVVETIQCEKVVLSAGSIQTPSILMRSGIGPRDVLERLGVPVLVDLPAVGAKLIDHPGILIALFPAEGVASMEDPVIQTTLRYTSRGSSRPNDMQLQPISSFQLEGGPVLMGISSVVGKPRAVGRLVFQSADPASQPSILPNLLGDDDDVERLIDSVELAVRASRTEAISKLGMVVWPTPDVFESRAAMAAWAKANCGSGYHPVGTAPMGAEGDPSAAVDQYGRVRGVSGLFVADASIMPTITSSNTNLPSIMIGERFGEWLREGLD